MASPWPRWQRRHKLAITTLWMFTHQQILSGVDSHREQVAGGTGRLRRCRRVDWTPRIQPGPWNGPKNAPREERGQPELRNFFSPEQLYSHLQRERCSVWFAHHEVRRQLAQISHCRIYAAFTATTRSCTFIGEMRFLPNSRARFCDTRAKISLPSATNPDK